MVDNYLGTWHTAARENGLSARGGARVELDEARLEGVERVVGALDAALGHLANSATLSRPNANVGVDVWYCAAER